LLGYTYDEFLGKELWEIGLFGDKNSSQAIYRELQEKGYIRYDNLPLETKHCKSAEVEFISNIYQVDHRLVAQCNIRDISQRSRLERKTKEQAEALADLHRRKDEFLAMLSHELRNPLAAICNAGHLLRLQKDENSLQKQARNIIERQSAQLTQLVDDLLEVSRITTGRVQLRQERVAVSGIVERAVEAVRPLIDKQSHELTVSLPSETIWLHADPVRLEQVVGNLLTNAAKYTDKRGHIWLTVEPEGDQCVLRVRDTGVGLAPNLLPRIFDLFTQAERSLDRSQGGLGIGLALVQRLVEMHHGKVEVHSTLGKGSEFVVRLPVVPSPTPQSPSPTNEQVQPTRRSLRVLVVEDNADTAQGLALVLQAFGHQVRTVHDGVSALQAALDYQPNVVLLDIGLPGLNGLEVAKKMRKQPALKNVVLVAVTGYGTKTDHQRSQEAGFDYHLVKPADFKTVEQILASVAEKQRRR
jgi:signal transduction histidine kinase/CheY-like chemotaxis protein